MLLLNVAFCIALIVQEFIFILSIPVASDSSCGTERKDCLKESLVDVARRTVRRATENLNSAASGARVLLNFHWGLLIPGQPPTLINDSHRTFHTLQVPHQFSARPAECW